MYMYCRVLSGPKIFWEVNKRGMLDEWATLAAQGGGCGRRMCPLPRKAWKAKVLIDVSVPPKKHLNNTL